MSWFQFHWTFFQLPNASNGSNNGWAPIRREPIIWTNGGLVYSRIYNFASMRSLTHIYASLGLNELTHWGRVTHICVSDLTSIGSDNGLSPGRRQAIIRTNAGILLIRPLGTNFSEFLVEILIFSFKKMRLKVSSAKRRPFCLGLYEVMCPFFHLGGYL